MADVKHIIRHCMLYDFQLGIKANEAAKNVSFALGQNVESVRKYQRWFKKNLEEIFLVKTSQITQQ